MRKSQHPSAQATAEGFVTLFRSQTGKVRREVVLRLLEDEDLREDVEAALLWEERKHEKKPPFAALEEPIRKMKRKKILELEGKIHWEGDLNEMRKSRG